jgi:hypothetical protein
MQITFLCVAWHVAQILHMQWDGVGQKCSAGSPHWCAHVVAGSNQWCVHAGI